MYDIRHRTGIEAPQDRVLQALTTTDGVAAWWTHDTIGDAGIGGKLDLTFGGPDYRIVLEVDAVAPDRVVWRFVEGGPEEWLGTTAEFDLGHDDGETVVLFTHRGWREAGPFMSHCSSKWGTFLLSLKALAEGGEARPFPDEVKVSRWT